MTETRLFLNGRFYYHAWNLVYIDGRWIEADSIFNQIPADPTHVALIVGDISDAVEVMQFVRNITLEIMDAR